MAVQIRMNPLHASTALPKMGEGMKMPGAMTQRGLGGSHFANPLYVQQGHNIKKMGRRARRRK